jgi:hypothetical protein
MPDDTKKPATEAKTDSDDAGKSKDGEEAARASR